MTVYHPGFAAVMAGAVTLITLDELGVSLMAASVAGWLVGGVAMAIYLYLPLPRTNGGMMGGSTERYWGFTDDE